MPALHAWTRFTDRGLQITGHKYSFEVSTASCEAAGPGPGGPSERARTLGLLLLAAVGWVGVYVLN
ncbi:hypothetical protein C6A85_98360, partial [Mycobacterium sp. ITM-2017-0098]